MLVCVAPDLFSALTVLCLGGSCCGERMGGCHGDCRPLGACARRACARGSSLWNFDETKRNVLLRTQRGVILI